MREKENQLNKILGQYLGTQACRLRICRFSCLLFLKLFDGTVRKCKSLSSSCFSEDSHLSLGCFWLVCWVWSRVVMLGDVLIDKGAGASTLILWRCDGSEATSLPCTITIILPFWGQEKRTKVIIYPTQLCASLSGSFNQKIPQLSCHQLYAF